VACLLGCDAEEAFVVRACSGARVVHTFKKTAVWADMVREAERSTA
jgi:hypothetical protein